MKTFSTISHDLLLVPVPEGVVSYTIDEFGLWFVFADKEPQCVRLPGMGYKILGSGTADMVTEGEAATVVECTTPRVRGAVVQIAFYKNYQNEFSSLSHPLASLSSLVKSQGMEMGKVVIVYKKK